MTPKQDQGSNQKKKVPHFKIGCVNYTTLEDVS
jgi:hypothetical protein